MASDVLKLYKLAAGDSAEGRWLCVTTNEIYASRILQLLCCVGLLMLGKVGRSYLRFVKSKVD